MINSYMCTYTSEMDTQRERDIHTQRDGDDDYTLLIIIIINVLIKHCSLTRVKLTALYKQLMTKKTLTYISTKQNLKYCSPPLFIYCLSNNNHVTETERYTHQSPLIHSDTKMNKYSILLPRSLPPPPPPPHVHPSTFNSHTFCQTRYYILLESLGKQGWRFKRKSFFLFLLCTNLSLMTNTVTLNLVNTTAQNKIWRTWNYYCLNSEACKQN